MGLYYLYENYSGGGYTQYYFECYNINGDPSIRLWSSNPSDPPETPTKPVGPTQGVINEEYTFSTSTTEPDGEQIYYMFDWGDGTYSEWIGPYSSGQTCYGYNAWTELGDYEIRVTAKDEHNAQSDWSDALVISIIENEAPNDPSIDGQTNGEVGKTYLYRVSAIDPNDHDVSFFIMWGDDTDTGWFGPYASGEEAHATHTWNESGTFTVKVKAKDVIGFESGWTTLSVTMPVNQITSRNIPSSQTLESMLKTILPLSR